MHTHAPPLGTHPTIPCMYRGRPPRIVDGYARSLMPGSAVTCGSVVGLAVRLAQLYAVGQGA